MSDTSRRRKRIDEDAEDDAAAAAADASETEQPEGGDAEDDDDGKRKRKRRKSKAAAAAAAGSDVDMEGSGAEEGSDNEASGSGSGSGSGSDGGSGSEDEEDRDDEDAAAEQFDEQGYGDEADRARLEAMPQVEREQLLFERQTAREEAQQRREAKREEREHKRAKKKEKSKEKDKGKDKKKQSAKERKKAAKKAEKKAAKKLAKKEEKEAKEKQSSAGGSRAAKRDADAKRSRSEALADLVSRKTQKVTTSKASSSKKAKRAAGGEGSDEEAEDEDEEEEEEEEASGASDDDAAAVRRRARKKKSSSYGSDEDEQLQDVADAGAEDDAEAEEDDLSGLPRTRTPIELEQAKSIQLRRVALEKIIEEPFFTELVTNMFVRLSLGVRPDGTPSYRLCQIAGVQEWKGKYKFGVPPKDCRVALLLRYGAHERLWACSSISNSSLEASEFTKWLDQMKTDGKTPPTKEECARWRKKALTLRKSYEYSPDVIARIIAEKRAQGRISLKGSNVTMERERLTFEYRQAENLGDEATMARVAKQLDELAEHASALQSKASGDSKQRQSVFGILDINKRNVESNTNQFEEMLKVQRDEKRRQDAEAARRRAAGEAPAPVERDAFKRKETRPTMEFIVDAEAVAERNKAAKAAEQAAKEADKKRREEQARLAKIHAARNKLEHFDELEAAGLQPLATPTAAAAAATSFSAGMPAVASSSSSSSSTAAALRSSRFLHLPSLPSMSDKLVALLSTQHRQAGNEVQLGMDTDLQQQPSTTLASVLGRFVSPSGGFGAYSAPSSSADAQQAYTKPPLGAHVISIDDYVAQRMM